MNLLSSTRNTTILIVLSLYLLLDAGFMLIRAPLGGAMALPTGEILLLLCLLVVTDYKWIPHLSRTVFIVPFLIWWVLGGMRTVIGIGEHGVWALRDATHLIESLFLWVGFVFASRQSEVERLFRWLPWLLITVCLYSLLKPFQETLVQYSPTVEGLAEYSAPLLFNFTMTSLLILVAAAYLILFQPKFTGTWSTPVAGLLIAYVILVFHTRTNYLQVMALIMLFTWYRRAAISRLAFAGVMALGVLLLVMEMDLPIETRLGGQLSLEFFAHHLGSMVGIRAEGVEGAAQGFWQRLDWWSVILRQVMANLTNFLFGLGYGIPLTDFIYINAAVVREPHNSLLSVIGRIGFVGLIAFLWMHVELIRVWLSGMKAAKKIGYRVGQNRLLLFMVFYVVVWVYSLGEDAFEKPYVAIPYYFFWGVTLHFAARIRKVAGAIADGEHDPVRSVPGLDHAYPHRS